MNTKTVFLSKLQETFSKYSEALKDNVQLKTKVLLLGLMNQQLEKNTRNFVFVYDNCCEIIMCSKLERHSATQNRGMVGKEIAKEKTTSTFIAD